MNASSTEVIVSTTLCLVLGTIGGAVLQNSIVKAEVKSLRHEIAVNEKSIKTLESLNKALTEVNELKIELANPNEHLRKINAKQKLENERLIQENIRLRTEAVGRKAWQQ